MPKTSHKKHRPFDFRLISLVEKQPVLYRREMGLNYFESMKTKNLIWQDVADKLNTTSDFCIKRWSNLRGQFQKELRYCRDLCPRLGVIRGSSWPYLERMRFLEPVVRINRSTGKIRGKEQSNRGKCPDYEFTDSDWSIDAEEQSRQSDNARNGVEIPFVSEDCSICPVEQPNSRQDDKYLQRSNILKILKDLHIEKRQSAERRIIMYLCQCQIRTLNNQTIDDLTI